MKNILSLGLLMFLWLSGCASNHIQTNYVSKTCKENNNSASFNNLNLSLDKTLDEFGGLKRSDFDSEYCISKDAFINQNTIGTRFYQLDKSFKDQKIQVYLVYDFVLNKSMGVLFDQKMNVYIIGDRNENLKNSMSTYLKTQDMFDKVDYKSTNSFKGWENIDTEGGESVDTIDRLVGELDDSLELTETEEDDFNFHPIEKKYVKLDVASLKDAPNGINIGKLLRGDEVFIYDYSNNWVRISKESEIPKWINSSWLCATKNCNRVLGSTNTMQSKIPLVIQNNKKSLNKIVPNTKKTTSVSQASRTNRLGYIGSCSCAVVNYCVGPRGGHYCYTSGGNKRYLPR